MVTNQLIRKKAQENGVKLWEIADKFGYTDAYFSRLLRHDFSKEKTEQALSFIEEIARGRSEA